MSDLVVTCPKGFFRGWIAEGDAAPGTETPPGVISYPSVTGEEWAWFLGGPRPPIKPGERLYVVAWGRLRGYAPVTRVVQTAQGWAICRRGGAVAVTIDDCIPGFRGYRRVWWNRSAERPFPTWQTEEVGP